MLPDDRETIAYYYKLSYYIIPIALGYMKETNETHYHFDLDYQQEILQFTVTDLRYGYKAIPLFESHYFTTVEHALIADGLKRYYNKRFTVPSQAILKEELRQMFRLKQYQSLMDTGDKEKVFKIVKKIYLRPVKNAEDIYEGCKQFAQYSAFKSELEDVDINDPSQYANYVSRIHKAVNIGTNLTDDKPLFILADMKSRIVRRRDSPLGFPTPFRQLNSLMNNGGTSVGNVIVIMAPAKRFKTGVILNLARGYLKRGKVTYIADFENGKDSLGVRVDQGIANVDRKQLLSQGFDQKLLKMGRQYRRFGGEIIIERFPAGSSTRDIEAGMKKVRDEYGIKKIHNAIIDYPDVMGDTKNTQDETKRISQTYIDIKNLADSEQLESVWCPSHINREGDNKQGKRFKANDISKAIDKVRHADMILGINQDDDEREAGILRIEIIDQRDGPQDGAVYCWVDIKRQRLKEFNQKQVDEIIEMRKEHDDVPDKEEVTKRKKRVSDV